MQRSLALSGFLVQKADKALDCAAVWTLGGGRSKLFDEYGCTLLTKGKMVRIQ